VLELKKDTNLRGKRLSCAVGVTWMPQVVTFHLLWMGPFDSRWTTLVPHPSPGRLIHRHMRIISLSIAARFRRSTQHRIAIHRHHLLIHRLWPLNYHFLICIYIYIQIYIYSKIYVFRFYFSTLQWLNTRWARRLIDDERGDCNRDALLCDRCRRRLASNESCQFSRHKSKCYAVGRRNRFGAVAPIHTHRHAHLTITAHQQYQGINSKPRGSVRTKTELDFRELSNNAGALLKESGPISPKWSRWPSATAPSKESPRMFCEISCSNRWAVPKKSNNNSNNNNNQMFQQSARISMKRIPFNLK